MRLAVLFLAAIAAVPCWAQEVKLPAEIRGAVGAWIIVAPESVDGGKPKWRIDPRLQEVRLDLLFPPEIVDQAKGRVFTSTVPGRFTVESWNAKADVASDISTCVVIIGTPPPVVVEPVDPVDPLPLTPATAATYIYEKDQTAIPAPVASALNKLNREKKIIASTFEQDTVDGTGQTPQQYAKALAAARSAGLPALVVTSGSAVLRVVKNPLTEQAVLDAVK